MNKLTPKMKLLEFLSNTFTKISYLCFPAFNSDVRAYPDDYHPRLHPDNLNYKHRFLWRIVYHLYFRPSNFLYMKFLEFASRLHIAGHERWCEQQNIYTVEEKMATLNIYGWLCAGMNEQEVKEEIERRTCPDCGSQMTETVGKIIEVKRWGLITEGELVCLSDTCADWQPVGGSPHDIVDGKKHLKELDDIINQMEEEDI